MHLEISKNTAVSALKLDLSSEIITEEEIQNFCDFVKKSNLDLSIKIGGCDAFFDIVIAKKYNAKYILAPMIETKYALNKFIENCKQVYLDKISDINLFINIETITAYNNLDEILNSSDIKYIKGIVLGRDDMAKSIGLSLVDINSDKMFDIAQNMAEKIYKKNKMFIIGGQIRPNAIPFLKKISKEKLNGFETRKVLFSSSLINDELIVSALKFEIDCLKNSKYLNNLSSIQKRINELELCI